MALCWLPSGREVLLVRFAYTRAPDHPRIIVTSLQSETRWRLERRNWPRRTLRDSCSLRLPTGWFDNVVASPRGDLAAVYWQEQDRAGFELVALGAGEVRQLPGAGYRAATNWVVGPVFSPGGEFLLLSCGPGACWWAADADDYDAPSAGGLFHMGDVVIVHTVTGTPRTIGLDAEIPAGWLPDDLDSGEAETLGKRSSSRTRSSR